MNDGTFKKVEKSSRTLYGPRAMLVCGFSRDDHEKLIGLLKTIEVADLPVIFTTDIDGESVLQELMCRSDGSGQGTDCTLERAIIIAGITENEFHQTLSAYRQSGLPRPLWATLTPFSESWRLSALLEELKKEREAMETKKS